MLVPDLLLYRGLLETSFNRLCRQLVFHFSNALTDLINISDLSVLRVLGIWDVLAILGQMVLLAELAALDQVAQEDLL
jgi:hypothetical protein